MNPFILQQLFGFPVVFVGSKVPTGGISFDGTGEKYADFLYRNELTDDACIIEIKKPSTRLLTKKPYRGNVYGPSTELAGGISQLLDQRYQLQRQLDVMSRNSRVEVESYYIATCLIIGRTPVNDDEKRQIASLKSLELIRHNSRNVTIMTFDDVIQRLRQLVRVLGHSEMVGTAGDQEHSAGDQERSEF